VLERQRPSHEFPRAAAPAMRLHATLSALLFLVLVPFVAAGCATDSSVRAQAADANKELEPAILNDAELVGYMQDIGKRIVASAKERDAAHDGPKTHFEEKNDWMFSTEEFHLVNSKQLNAFTTGGTHLYIYTQLMQQCASEDELAAVMSHEYAHVYSRHVHKGVDRSHFVLGGALVLGAAGYAVGGKEHGGEIGRAHV
jgi:predicted Zn-dependent protease